MVYSCHASAWEAEAGEFKFKLRLLSQARPCLKNFIFDIFFFKTA
jgi:hypothetical protein